MAGWWDHNRLAWPLNGGDRRAGGSHSRRGPSDRGRRVGLPRELEGAADGGLAFPHGRRRDLPRTAGSVRRGRRRKLRKWRVGFPRQRRPAGMSQAAIRQAWVSGNPAGLSQQQSGRLESAAIRRAWVRARPAGIESEAGRQALSQRQAGGHWVQRWAGGPRVSRGRRHHLLRTVGWLIRERRRKTPANGGHEGSRRADSLAARTKHGNNQKTWKTNKTKRGEGTTLTVWSGLLSRWTQQGETRNTQTRRYFKIIVFNDDIKVRQGQCRTPGNNE